ncbi:hypothetical protein [Phocaeicola abscessus]|uniref:hypothetical protein n=1 Tax=Phocaeicola abscessus TaxID=555313 RepID=UPI0003863424|nr:hypothetical protein [Phocaeicola abscessus]EPT33603.1 hypothetical protein HMPREF9012_0485 [Bacteroidetes bacterium oral taxon 272 str. F0290]
MSLDTVLKIGEALRQSDDSLKYFKYIESCPTDNKGNYPLCITIPVKEDFSFDWNGIKITPENERDKLYYLKFKTSDSDGLVKYIFGDIYYEKKASVKKDGTIESNEGGYYRLANPNASSAYRLSSFYRGDPDFNNIIVGAEKSKISTTALQKIRQNTKDNLDLLEKILEYSSAVEYYFSNIIDKPFKDFLSDKEMLFLYATKQNFLKTTRTILNKLGVKSNFDEFEDKEKIKLFTLTNTSIFIHFQFDDKKHWYHFTNEVSLVNTKMLSDFFENSGDGFVLKKTLYKTLCSGDKKNDIQFPGFKIQDKYKSKSFIEDDMQNLFYALSYTNKGKTIQGTDIKLIVLPRGENLTAKDYEDFQEKQNEVQIVANNASFNSPLFDFAETEKAEITAFDLIFTKKGGTTSPDKDLVEISGVEKSKLRQIKERIEDIAKDVYKKRKEFINTEKDLIPLSPEYSFKNILGNPLADKNGKVKFDVNPKYQSHLLKVLPLIYSDSYFKDDMLLDSFVQNVEYSIRSGDSKYNFLKFDLIFLLKIQNNINDKYMEIIQSESYEIGLMLGALAKNLSLEINSFEKNYVGNLTRRIGTLSDFIKLKTDIEQKLIMHDKSKFTFQMSYDLAQKVKNFKSQYDKEECAFGFMESYFKPLPKNDKKEEERINNN